MIRTAAPQDASGMVEARREAISSRARSHYGQRGVDAWVAEATPERVERVIADRDLSVLVAEAKNELIGFAVAVPATGELRAMYVKPNGIGGVGRALLSALEKDAFRSADAITCIAALNAVPFYKSNGFTEEGMTEIVDGSGVSVPCVRMKKVRRNAD